MEFKLISIASIIAFYGCYFVKMFHQKKQGIQTDQIGKNKVGFVKFVEITMKIAAILVFIAGLSSIFFETEHNPVSVRIFGAILSVAGTAIFIVAVWTMRDSWRAGVSKTDKTELVTNGILCFLTVFAVIMYHLQIVNVEEDFLFATFGNEYLQYKKKVCRYIGRKR